MTVFLVSLLALALVLAIFLLKAAAKTRSDSDAKSDSLSATPAAADAVQAPDHNHAHDHNHQEAPADLRPLDDDFAAVHRGKARAGGCKFDPDVVRRTRFARHRPSMSAIFLRRIPA